MVHGIREVFLTDLENLDWMDEETKRQAKKKVFFFFFKHGSHTCDANVNANGRIYTNEPPPRKCKRKLSSTQRIKIFFIFVSLHLRLRSIPTSVNRGNTNANAMRKTKVPSVPCHHGKVQKKMALPIFIFCDST